MKESKRINENWYARLRFTSRVCPRGTKREKTFLCDIGHWSLVVLELCIKTYLLFIVRCRRWGYLLFTLENMKCKFCKDVIMLLHFQVNVIGHEKSTNPTANLRLCSILWKVPAVECVRTASTLNNLQFFSSPIQNSAELPFQWTGVFGSAAICSPAHAYTWNDSSSRAWQPMSVDASTVKRIVVADGPQWISCKLTEDEIALFYFLLFEFIWRVSFAFR